MAAWWVDRVLPGLTVAVVSAPVALWFQHRAFTRKVGSITREQTAELKQHLHAGGGERPL